MRNKSVVAKRCSNVWLDMQLHSLNKCSHWLAWRYSLRLSTKSSVADGKVIVNEQHEF